VDLAVLDIFRAVAQEQSVTKAAQRLDRVQSNVTTRLKQLEDDLGVALFLREGKRMTLTAEGERFLVYAEQLLSLADEARQSLHPAQPSGRLRVGTMESTAASRLPQPLAEYHARWPEVELTITTATSQDLIEAVRARRIDCALVADPAAAAPCNCEALGDNSLEWTRIYTEQLMLVLPERHPKATTPDKVTVRTLAGFGRGCTYRDIAENWFAASSSSPDRKLKVLEVNSYHAILACVAAGACVGIVPQSVLELQGKPANIRAVPLMKIDTLLVNRRGYRTAAYDEFRRVLRAK
jgi:DNA-binding transcriptional LysR family regulator